ncbi:cadherin-like domain-containing protein, partial [Octadecabacter sp.]|nr:cadherin-like domain-containing protein [Octadecabacter sp.]
NLLQQIGVLTGDGGQQVLSTKLENVASIEVILAGSGAIDNLTYAVNPVNLDGNDIIDGGDGQDVIEGNAGEDVLSGGAGNDVLVGGEGADMLEGGSGDDTLFADADDTNIDGGADGTDFDTLNLTGEGPFFLDNVVEDGNGNGINGTVVFIDEDGNPTGATLNFTEIEQVIGDEVNGGPGALNDAAIIDEDEVITIDVLGNDRDPDGDPLTVTAAASPNGEVTINADGAITFVPDENFNGDTTITYTVDDGNGGTDTANVSVTVNPVNDAPDAVDDVDLTGFNTAVAVDLLANDLDVDGDALTVIQTSVSADQGSLIDNGDGTVTFTPAKGFVGEAAIAYTVRDAQGLTDSAIHTVAVEAGVLDGTVSGTVGDDLIDADFVLDAEGDRIDNNDAIFGDVGSNDDVVDAGDGKDTVISGDGSDTVYGQGGDDTLLSGVGDDTVFGGEGDDDIGAGADNDLVSGGEGNDTIDGADGDDTLSGGAGNDTVFGGNYEDMIFGGAGDDVIDGGSSNDTIEGGSGNDTITGGLGNDDVRAASGDDFVDGGQGDDTIVTAEGNDIVEGGDGNDIIDTSNDENPFTNDPGQNLPDVGFPGLFPADDDPSDDRDTVFGGAGNDSITTGDDDDIIFGGNGDDAIDAGFDDDVVEGGIGRDTIVGGEGNDEIFGSADDDTIFGGLVTPGPADVLNLPDDEDPVDFNNNDTLFGGDGNDRIFGADDDDSLFGGDGNDVLLGGVDEDAQFGGAGNDTFIVDQTGDGAGDRILGGEDFDGGDQDVLDLTGSGVDFITFAQDDTEAGTATFLDGSTLTFSEIENVIPCFTPGTKIATPRGERLVENLRVGDRIITRDNGIQEIRWLGRKDISGKAMMSNPHLKPILLRAGSLENGLPERDMLVSPNHRVLVAS